MDLRTGFQLEDPAVFVPWTVTEAGLRTLLSPHGLRKVTTGYFTISCRSLNGLNHELGFHFKPRGGDRLDELEFFRRAYPDEAASFEEFQTHLERTFGPPTETHDDGGGFPTHQWHLPGADIIHLVKYRFAPEEHVRIRRSSP
jgi:hypothetical protein